MVELPSQPLGDIDPEFQAIALETGEWTYVRRSQGSDGTLYELDAVLGLADDHPTQGERDERS